MNTPPRKRREDLQPGEILCEYCTAKCCRYFAFPIDTPRTYREFEYLRWYMLHGRVSVFVDEGTWYLMVHADCRHLTAENRCNDYENRPPICREYTTDNCEYDDDACYEKYFETPEQIQEYAEALLWKKRRKKAKRDVGLPILSGAALDR